LTNGTQKTKGYIVTSKAYLLVTKQRSAIASVGRTFEDMVTRLSPDSIMSPNRNSGESSILISRVIIY
jgi:hypothetical protein